ncbi:MAG: MFS transporter, partial [Solirubrobacteraceae bacterium]
LSGLPAGFVLIAAAFCLFQAVQVVVEARLQDEINGAARSTVTSLAGLATEVLVVTVFAGYAAGSALAGHATLFGVFAAVYVVIAAAMWRGGGGSRNSSDRG